MKTIPLSNSSLVAIVDDDSYDRLSRYSWRLSNKGYAHRVSSGHGIMLHHAIVGTGRFDHIDRNRLNCQRSNLRPCTRSQNQANRGPYGKSKYKGVTVLDKPSGIYYTARCVKDGVSYYAGCFKSEEDAARAYDSRAKELHGKFAYLNFP